MTRLLGCDFSSSPSKRKQIVVAWGEAAGDRVVLKQLQFFSTLKEFSDGLHTPGPWVGGFDLPFGLPRELVETLGWPTDWLACMQQFAQLSREDIRAQFAAFCNQRPVGGKFAHRATDLPAGSSPSMKWVNPPVAFMLHAGVPLLRGAQAIGLCEALEQPALLLGRHARAGIHHHELDPFRPERLHFEGDAALRGELDGIAAEIQEYLADTPDVADKSGRQFRINLQIAEEPFLPRHRFEQGLHLG